MSKNLDYLEGNYPVLGPILILGLHGDTGTLVSLASQKNKFLTMAMWKISKPHRLVEDIISKN